MKLLKEGNEVKLHHMSLCIVERSLNIAMKFVQFIGFEITYKDIKNKFFIATKDGFRIQFIECMPRYLPLLIPKEKTYTHIGLTNKNPKAYMQEVDKFAKEYDLVFQVGKWSNKELYFNLPEIFGNFVVEVMEEVD
jgi:hypothetical protein